MFWIALLLATITQQVFSLPKAVYNYTYSLKTGNWTVEKIDEPGESSTKGESGSEGATGEEIWRMMVSTTGQIMVSPNGVKVFHLKKAINTSTEAADPTEEEDPNVVVFVARTIGPNDDSEYGESEGFIMNADDIPIAQMNQIVLAKSRLDQAMDQCMQARSEIEQGKSQISQARSQIEQAKREIGQAQGQIGHAMFKVGPPLRQMVEAKNQIKSLIDQARSILNQKRQRSVETLTEI